WDWRPNCRPGPRCGSSRWTPRPWPHWTDTQLCPADGDVGGAQAVRAGSTSPTGMSLAGDLIDHVGVLVQPSLGTFGLVALVLVDDHVLERVVLLIGQGEVAHPLSDVGELGGEL